MEGIDVIERAYRLMLDGWTSHAFARNCDGEKVGTDSPDATSFCTGGALWRAATKEGVLQGDAYKEARAILQERLNMNVRIGHEILGLAHWNDTVGRDTVIETFESILIEAGRIVPEAVAV